MYNCDVLKLGYSIRRCAVQYLVLTLHAKLLHLFTGYTSITCLTSQSRMSSFYLPDLRHLRLFIYIEPLILLYLLIYWADPW